MFERVLVSTFSFAIGYRPVSGSTDDCATAYMSAKPTVFFLDPRL